MGWIGCRPRWRGRGNAPVGDRTFSKCDIDIQVYLGVIGLVAVVTLLAGYVPAWRAAGVNPVKSSRRSEPSHE